jgi:hypothetical protein
MSWDVLQQANDAESWRVVLHREGWLVGETAFTDRGGSPTWIVTGQKDDVQIHAEGATRYDALREACKLVFLGDCGFAVR